MLGYAILVIEEDGRKILSLLSFLPSTILLMNKNHNIILYSYSLWNNLLLLLEYVIVLVYVWVYMVTTDIFLKFWELHLMDDELCLKAKRLEFSGGD